MNVFSDTFIRFLVRYLQEAMPLLEHEKVEALQRLYKGPGKHTQEDLNDIGTVLLLMIKTYGKKWES